MTVLFFPITTIYVLIHLCLYVFVVLGLIFGTLHRLGIWERVVHVLVERELSKAFNEATVTLGFIQFDILKGRVTGKDLIIHSPNRNDWKWDSPCILRVGWVDVRFSLLSVIDILRSIMEIPVIDIYSIHVEDLQCFVEKRRNVFNFHLLDPSLDVPPAVDVMKSLQESHQIEQTISLSKTTSSGDGTIGIFNNNDTIRSASSSSYSSALAMSSNCINNELNSSSLDKDNDAIPADLNPVHNISVINKNVDTVSEMNVNVEKSSNKANEIVSKLVSNIGDPDPSQNLLSDFKNDFVTQLKKIQNQFQYSDSNNSAIALGSMLANRTVEAIQEIGKVHEIVKEVKHQVDSLSKPPPKKEGYIAPPLDNIRIGRIVVQQFRIFTRDIILDRRSSSNENDINSKDGIDEQENNVTKLNDSVLPGQIAGKNDSYRGWQKPIYISEFCINDAELCTPAFARDENTDPIIGQNVEGVANVIIKRLAAELAQRNAGRVLDNAYSEIFSWMKTQASVNKNTFNQGQN